MRTEHRIKAVIDLRSEARDEDACLAAQGIDFLHLPTQDLGAVTLGMLDAGVAFARTYIERRNRVLIHCEHGIGRSATLALCALVDGGLPPMTALRLAKDRRERVSPSPAQYECFCGWLTLHRARLGGAWDLPRFDDFAAIAYRHLKGGA